MSFAKIIIFDVDHGFCASVTDSDGNLLLIDCGRKKNFSPLRYLAKDAGHDLSDLTVDYIILSHPHGDHIEDVDSLAECKVRNRSWVPLSNFTDDELHQSNTDIGFQNLKKFEREYAHFTSEGFSPPVWDFSLNVFSLPVSVARGIDDTNVINNSSKVIIIELTGKKIIFCGDIQKNCWEQFLQIDNFIKSAESPSVIITPHHGHRSSYSLDLYETIGKPFFNICSLASGDPHIAGEYSTDQTCRGAELYGQFRRMLSTRSDGSIFICFYEQSWSVDFSDLPDKENISSFSNWY